MFSSSSIFVKIPFSVQSSPEARSASQASKRCSRCTGRRVRLPDVNRKVTDRIRPSRPGWVASTRARCHWPRAKLSSLTRTKSPLCISRPTVNHFLRGIKDFRYSACQRFQNPLTSFWWYCKRLVMALEVCSETRVSLAGYAWRFLPESNQAVVPRVCTKVSKRTTVQLCLNFS